MLDALSRIYMQKQVVVNLTESTAIIRIRRAKNSRGPIYRKFVHTLYVWQLKFIHFKLILMTLQRMLHPLNPFALIPSCIWWENRHFIVCMSRLCCCFCCYCCCYCLAITCAKCPWTTFDDHSLSIKFRASDCVYSSILCNALNSIALCLLWMFVGSILYIMIDLKAPITWCIPLNNNDMLNNNIRPLSEHIFKCRQTNFRVFCICSWIL